jgi:hypothetical protein
LVISGLVITDVQLGLPISELIIQLIIIDYYLGRFDLRTRRRRMAGEGVILFVNWAIS